jgi:hypothetical protein
MPRLPISFCKLSCYAVDPILAEGIHDVNKTPFWGALCILSLDEEAVPILFSPDSYEI